MIIQDHIKYHDEIFDIPRFLSNPVLCFGFHDIEQGVLLKGLQHSNLVSLLTELGFTASSLDLYDPRASLSYDMNYPVPKSEHNKYGALIDIGSLEHVFDTRQCLENCLRMVAVGGHYMLHAPVNGYYGHGFHTFHPSALLGALELNGFKVIYKKYSREDGTSVTDPGEGGDILIWLVAVKEADFEEFKNPQQEGWRLMYDKSVPPTPKFEMRVLPRLKVTLTMYLPYGYSAGQYHWALMKQTKEVITRQVAEASVRDGHTALVLQLDLTPYPSGDYLLAISEEEDNWTYTAFRLISKVSLDWVRAR
jgi:hypothetical protein